MQRNTSVWVVNSLRSAQPISRQSQRLTLVVTVSSLNQDACLCPEADQTGAHVRAGRAVRRNSVSGETTVASVVAVSPGCSSIPTSQTPDRNAVSADML